MDNALLCNSVLVVRLPLSLSLVFFGCSFAIYSNLHFLMLKAEFPETDFHAWFVKTIS